MIEILFLPFPPYSLAIQIAHSNSTEPVSPRRAPEGHHTMPCRIRTLAGPQDSPCALQNADPRRSRTQNALRKRDRWKYILLRRSFVTENGLPTHDLFHLSPNLGRRTITTYMI